MVEKLSLGSSFGKLLSLILSKPLNLFHIFNPSASWTVGAIVQINIAASIDLFVKSFSFLFIFFGLLAELSKFSFLDSSDIAGMLLRSTGDFLDTGLQKIYDEFCESADGSTALDDIR